MKKSAHRTSTTIMGQTLYSPRYDKVSAKRKWLSTMEDIREKFSTGDEITAEERRVLEMANFKFEIFKGDILFNSLVAKFLVHRDENFVKSTSTFTTLHIRKYIQPKFGGRNVYSITPSECRTLVENLKIKDFGGYEKDDKDQDDETRPIYSETDKKAGESLKRCVRVALSLIFDFAIMESLVSKNFMNPAKYVVMRGSRKQKKKDSINFWKSRADIENFLETAKAPAPLNKKDKPLWPAFMSSFCVNGLEGGPRKGELIGLQWSDLNDEAGYIHLQRILEEVSNTIEIRTKSGDGVTRKIPYQGGMKTATNAWRKISKFTKPKDFVYTTPKGEFISPNMVNRWFTRICEVAGVEDVGPHGMRHTFAVWYLIMGGKIEDLQVIMGHASIVTTQVYAKIVEEFLLAKNSPVSFSKSQNISETIGGKSE